MICTGDKIINPKAHEWGVGKVLELTTDDKARVFFLHAGEKLLSLKHVTLDKVDSSENMHPILDNPSLAERSKGKNHRSLPDARSDFLRHFPKGFEDSEYFRHERNYKLEAHVLLQKLLGKEVLNNLIVSGEFTEVSRRAMQLVNKTNLISPFEKMAFSDGVKKTAENEKLLATSLYNLLYGVVPMQERFESFSTCLDALDAAKWTIATYFLFLAFPEEHMFLKPTVTQHAAELVKAVLNYKPELNWLTYKCLLEFSEYLKDELVSMDMPPRDMIDVQSFMWCIAPGTYD
ncbi:MAG: DUF3553 domain-containing protein [Chlorobium sp.]|nr:DUF3553 domain-containing protein [Chlorobium sp.]